MQKMMLQATLTDSDVLYWPSSFKDEEDALPGLITWSDNAGLFTLFRGDLHHLQDGLWFAKQNNM